VQVRELPGISPGIVRYLLPHVVFARIADLGYELPPYEERVARLDMSPSQAAQVHGEVYDPRSNTGWLYKRMLDALKNGDNSLLSVWLQTALARPNSAFRADDVTRTLKRTPFNATDNNTLDITIASERRKLLRKGGERVTLMQLAPTIAANEWLPKEKWLMDYCAGEALRGRKVLVYVRQTGTRDIQPRLAEALRSAGLRPKILRPSVPPERREAWARENAQDTQVLITNPKLIETGLDLVAYGSVVFFEIEYTLYTLWQAMRRVWRLGQTQPVTVTFLSYRDTLEDLALKLMGRKLYAAQLLYGDEIGGAIVESDDGNFLAELARAAISGAPVDDYAALFMRQTQNVAQDAPAEKVLPAPAVRIVTGSRGVTMSDLRAVVGRSMRRTSQMPAVVPETQIGLFG
jgi:SNF2 family DNA or RNA helicase